MKKDFYQGRKVSVITPCLNSEKTIRQTIESVLNQSYTNLEYIIIDGKSEDKTREIIEEYVPLFQGKLKYISEKDGGIYDAMNKGISLAKGEIIGIINSDDWYEADTIEKIVRCFETNDKDVVYGNIHLVTMNGEKKKYPKKALNTLWYQMAIPHPAVFVKQDIYRTYGVFNTKYRISADYEMLLRFYSVGVKFFHLDAVLANFREGGMSQINNLLAWDELYDCAWYYFDRCPYKRYIYPILKKNYGFFLLEKLLLEEPHKIQSVIYKLIGKSIDKLVIFGVGNWGTKCDEALSYTETEVMFFLDNKAENGQEYRGKKVYKPCEIACDEEYILVAIREDEEVKQQLCNLGAKKIITLREMINSYFDINNKQV